MSMINPLVSVIVPVYGVEKLIERCSISLFEQTYDNIEYIFVNDCTKDNSIGILKEIIQRYPSKKTKIKIINHSENMGLAASRNTGVDNSSGVFILHVDSDDYVDYGLVEALVTKQRETNADIVSCDFFYHYRDYVKKSTIQKNDDGRTYLNSLLLGENLTNIWGRLIRSSIYRDNNIFENVGHNMAEDLQTIPRLFYYAKNIAFVDNSYYHYCKDNENAYTYDFDEKKRIALDYSYEYLYSFFSDKDSELLINLKAGELKSLINELIDITRIGGHVLHYKVIAQRIKNAENLSKNRLSLLYRELQKYCQYRMIIFLVSKAGLYISKVRSS